MYFAMKCRQPLTKGGEALMNIHNCFTPGKVWSWREGRRVQRPATLPTPIPIDFEPLHGYDGPPVEMRDVCIPLMSIRMAEVLKRAGVDNIELYPALLTNIATGKTYDYHAFNVVGLVSAADLAKSDWSTFDGSMILDVSFTRFALDESKPAGVLLFRLAENANGLFVHESVRDHVIAAGINTLHFMEPRRWMHI